MTLQRVGVVGACGYAGRELVRWITLHPQLQLCSVYSRSKAGQAYADVVPDFLGFVSLTLESIPLEFTDLDVLFLATPHGATAELIPLTKGIPIVVDLSRDHRHVDEWVYAQPEWRKSDIIGASKIAAPGCFATAISLGVAPLVSEGVLTGPIRVCAATGSTGSGATPKATTHHPERMTNMRAYKVFKHQHVPEIEGFLAGIGTAPQIDFVPVSAPVDRGIFATIFADVHPEMDVQALFQDTYGDKPLIRLRTESPDLRLLRGTAMADISIFQDGTTVAILVAIDNLGKGASAQAIQALNISLGLEETTGLLLPSCSP